MVSSFSLWKVLDRKSDFQVFNIQMRFHEVKLSNNAGQNQDSHGYYN